MRNIVNNYNGQIIISAGGKLTATFEDINSASLAREEVIKLVSTNLPMLEFQCSEIVEDTEYSKAFNRENGIKTQLSELKRRCRGYGYTYNPLFLMCSECGEYPAEVAEKYEKEETFLCRICSTSKEHSKIKVKEMLNKPDERLTSVKRIYKRYFQQFSSHELPEIPFNFENLFHKKSDSNEKQMLAVWCSDVNNMGEKLSVLFIFEDKQSSEIFEKITDFNIRFVSGALIKTFGTSTVES